MKEKELIDVLENLSFITTRSPCDDDHEVHYVPHVSQVAPSMKNEAECEDSEGCLNGEDAQKVGLSGLLRKECCVVGRSYIFSPRSYPS